MGCMVLDSCYYKACGSNGADLLYMVHSSISCLLPDHNVEYIISYAKARF